MIIQIVVNEEEGQKMIGKKGNQQIIIGIVVIIILAFAVGIISFESGKFVIPFLDQHKYLQEVDLSNNLTYNQDLEINILIKNPHQNSINPELEITYPPGWSTTNRYVRSNDRIPIGYMTSGKLEKYSIEFDPAYSLKDKSSKFIFTLYLNDQKVDSREEIVGYDENNGDYEIKTLTEKVCNIFRKEITIVG